MPELRKIKMNINFSKTSCRLQIPGSFAKKGWKHGTRNGKRISSAVRMYLNNSFIGQMK